MPVGDQKHKEVTNMADNTGNLQPNWYIAQDDGIETVIRDKGDPTEDGNGVVCWGATPGDARVIVLAPQLLECLTRMANSLEDDHQRCPSCEDESWYGPGHTSSCLLGWAKELILSAQLEEGGNP
jgi:hypothetical protein